MNLSQKIRVISRQSCLALLQVEEVFNAFPQLNYELIKIDSYGDSNKHISLLGNPPSDIFTRELDNALLQQKADIAIHSAKDLPYPLPKGIEVIALFSAFDQSDALVSRQHLSLKALPYGARVGTSSPVRRTELLALRPDVEVVGIRGTIEERIAQVDSGYIDALIVATCALKRLGLESRIAEILTFETHPLQGLLAITACAGSPFSSLFQKKDVRQSYGKVTLVGFGPGNADLLTLGGDKALAVADIIFYDDLLDKDFLQKYTAEKIFVGKRKNIHSFKQQEINQLLYKAAIDGKQVVRLKGGDPMVFAHGREEIDFLQSRMVQVSVIPGVSSGIALASYTKIPLTHRGVASSVAFVSGYSEKKLQIPNADTLVYYMGGSNAAEIARQIIESGRAADTPVALVHNVSFPSQQTFYATLGELRSSNFQYPTPILIVIGKVVALEHSFSTKNILVTGTMIEESIQELAGEKQLNIIHQPLIRITRIEQNEKLRTEIFRLKDYDYLFFTSRYTVEFFFEALKELHLDSRTLSRLKIAAIGNITAKALRAHGIEADWQPKEESSEGLLELIRKQQIPAGKVLIPRSELGLPVLPNGLSSLGWMVQTVAVYRNTLPDGLVALNLEGIESIVFSSPSCVTNFLQVYGSFPSGKTFIFRGRETENIFKKYANENVSIMTQI